MKPILFNTEMVRSILDGRKTVTRRVMRLPHCGYFEHEPPLGVLPPYHPGDILYVRETFCGWCLHGGKVNYCYKATDPGGNRYPTGPEYDDEWDVRPWRPSIHMPKEAARLFLRVTNVRVERLQDIDGQGILAEGVDNGMSNPTMGKRWESMQRMAFSNVWDSTIKKADLPLYGWDANPVVWVIEFERISREEALKDGTWRANNE